MEKADNAPEGYACDPSAAAWKLPYTAEGFGLPLEACFYMKCGFCLEFGFYLDFGVWILEFVSRKISP
ncbi:MAG: hypothetical protein LAO21_13405 [Acidobacteriia bacterium]|nr:hypothetical protein [Terriglobia bacterium]